MLLSFCYAVKLTPAKPLQTLSAILQVKDRKRKRMQESKDSHIRAPASPLQKRLRTSVAGSVVNTSGQESTSGITEGLKKATPEHNNYTIRKLTEKDKCALFKNVMQTAWFSSCDSRQVLYRMRRLEPSMADHFGLKEEVISRVPVKLMEFPPPPPPTRSG